jgi:hypothetical protein
MCGKAEPFRTSGGTAAVLRNINYLTLSFQTTAEFQNAVDEK